MEIANGADCCAREKPHNNGDHFASRDDICHAQVTQILCTVFLGGWRERGDVRRVLLTGIGGRSLPKSARSIFLLFFSLEEAARSGF